MYRTDFWTLWEKARVGCFERTASKHVYYLGWNRSPGQVGCMRQVLGAGALGRPRGIGWRGRWEGESGWEIHVNPWLIHINVWQKPLQYCKVISLRLIKKMEKKKNSAKNNTRLTFSYEWTILIGFTVFLRWLSGKESACNAREVNLIPASGRSPGRENGNPLQCRVPRFDPWSENWDPTCHGATNTVCHNKRPCIL